MTPHEKLSRAEETAEVRTRELVAMAAKHTRQGRWLVELLGCARKYVNADHAVGRARKAVNDGVS